MKLSVLRSIEVGLEVKHRRSPAQEVTITESDPESSDEGCIDDLIRGNADWKKSSRTK